MSRLIGLGILGCLAAPVVVPVAWMYRVGYEFARVAFRYPKTTAAAVALSGLLWHNGCPAKVAQELPALASRSKERLQASLLEKRVQGAAVAPPASPPHPRKEACSDCGLAQQMLEDPDFNFYYVKPGETLSGIAQRISGSTAASQYLAEDNLIAQPHTMPAGTLLRVRKSLCTRYVPGVYARVPALESVVLPGNVPISSYFGPRAQEVFQMNKALGLDYGETSPLRSRVVYYR